MTQWITVHDSRTERPEPIDLVSSPTTAYERKNIRQEETPDGETEWVYEQREYTMQEFAALKTLENANSISATEDAILELAELIG